MVVNINQGYFTYSLDNTKFNLEKVNEVKLILVSEQTQEETPIYIMVGDQFEITPRFIRIMFYINPFIIKVGMYKYSFLSEYGDVMEKGYLRVIGDEEEGIVTPDIEDGKIIFYDGK